MGEFKKLILPILGVIAFICFVGYLYRKPAPTPAPKQSTIKIGAVSVAVEKATTAEEKKKGLSGRDSLEKDKGMLFIMDKSDPVPTFWMKGMRFAIDIIWILSSSGDVKEGKVIQIDKNIQPPLADTPDNRLIRFSPKVQVDYVLETAAGFCDTNKIKVGDSFQIQSDQ